MSKKFQVIVADPPWNFNDKLRMSDVARGAQANYNTMTISQIKQLRVNDLATDGAILALWVPSSLLQDGLDTMKAWGFKHKQTYIWVKTKKEPFTSLGKQFLSASKVFMQKDFYQLGNFAHSTLINKFRDILKSSSKSFGLNNLLAFGMGRLFRQTHEICLIGTNSNKIYKQLANKSQRSVSFAENLKHSAKPEALQDSLEIMFPKSTKLELFARRHRKDWTCVGNEVCNGEDITVSLAKLL